jgi:excisionase family DNA binding protein
MVSEQKANEMLTTEEAAALVGLKPVSIQRAARLGKLKSEIVPVLGARHEYRFRKEDVLEWRKGVRPLRRPESSDRQGRTDLVTAHA